MKIAAVLLRILNLAPTENNIIGLGNGLVPKRRQSITRAKNDKVTFPVGIALDVSGSLYRILMGLPEISRAASTGRSHRMPYYAARPKRVNAHPPWAQLHVIVTYHESISTLHTWEIMCTHNCVQIVCEFNMSLLLYVCSQLVLALLLVAFFWIFPLLRACGSIEMK